MPITLQDRAPLEKVRKLTDGRIAAVAKFARSGCYRYAGSEVGRPDLPTVTVYRPESEVFDQAAMASFAHKAITLDHPSQAVTADNWKTHSVGWTEGKVARDGEFVEIPLMLADASAVRAYESGQARELSAGYTCELVWGDGIAPSGERFDAKQVAIRGNHIAVVGAARGGSQLRIGDAATSKDSQMILDAEVEREVSRARSEHADRFAFLGDRAPAFDADTARLVAASKLEHGWARSVRDAACGKYTPSAASAPRDDAARAASAEAMRNFARDSQY